MYVGVSQGKQNNVAALETRASIGLIECLLGIVNTFSLGKGNIRGRGEKKKSCQKYKVFTFWAVKRTDINAASVCIVVVYSSVYSHKIIFHTFYNSTSNLFSEHTRVYIKK